jgi:peptidoglycan/LPS O-acetylase OafA/YrhL
MNPVAQFNTLKAALATVLYSGNLYFAHLHVQYFFQHSATSPLLHIWSLAMEEQFYLIWPVLLLLLARTSKSVRGRSIYGAIASIADCVPLSGRTRVLTQLGLAALSRTKHCGLGGCRAF